MIEIESAKLRIARKVRTARGEIVVVELAAEGMYFREPGRRTRYLMPWGRAYLQAVALTVNDRPRPKRRRSARLSTRGA
jgi:hypothetical protein